MREAAIEESMIESSQAMLRLPPATLWPAARRELTSPLDSYREQLVESYDSPEQFAQGSRRLAESGWMIAWVSEGRAAERRLVRLFKPLTWH